MSQFVGYMVAGYPDRENSLRVIRDCCAAGMDILELGFPAADASCDGKVIREAQERADRSVAGDPDYWRRIRREIPIPIWLMGYRRDLLEGDVCLRMAEEKLYDALVIPDMTGAERAELRGKLAPLGVSVVGFIHDGMPAEELDRELAEADLIYHQLYRGPTGVAHTDSGYLKLYGYARERAKGKIYAGFGISTAERVRELLEHGYDGAGIGSAIVQHLTEGEDRAVSFIREIHETVRKEGAE